MGVTSAPAPALRPAWARYAAQGAPQRAIPHAIRLQRHSPPTAAQGAPQGGSQND